MSVGRIAYSCDLQARKQRYSIVMQFHVIDDEKSVSDIIVAMLNIQGFSAEAFNCPLRYLEYASSEEFEAPVAIMTDIIMPGMSGYELIDALRDVHSDQKYVVISALPDADIKQPAMRDIYAFINKPVRMEELSKVAASLVQCHKQETSEQHHRLEQRTDDSGKTESASATRPASPPRQ